MINRVIASRYRITERIGMGGMAEVYKAQDEVLGRVDAVKVLLPQFASDPTFAARFRQEAQAAANLSSPYIVNIYDWGLDDETYYIVMEYVRGVDLKTAIAQRGAIDQRKVAQIAAQVCAGLSVAHGYDVIHRDIKPQNIMIQPDGNIKIMDFGVARAGNSTMTQTGSVLGTANYVSPEQAQGRIPTAASDLYSLGILMYEAVTGKLPFEGPDAISVALKQVNEQPVPPSVYCPSLDPALEAIILKAMAKDPNDRFLSADEMRAAINAYLKGSPTTVLPVNDGGAVTQVIGTGSHVGNRGGSADVTSIYNGGGTGGGAGGITGGGVRRPDDDGKRTSGKKKAIIAIIIAAVIAAIGVGVFVLTSGSGSPVPNVVGMTQAQAEQAIAEAGFTSSVTTDYSETVEQGIVISQEPGQDTNLARGSTVKIVVSEGEKPPNKIGVPALDNMTPEEAQAALAKRKLVMTTGDSVFDENVEVGRVAKQNPAAGAMVDEGSTVTVYLSKGAEGVKVPSVVGYDEASAVSILENSGFDVNVSYESSDTVAVGKVISQSPDGGELAEPYSTINIAVSEASPTPVPNLQGLTLDQAKAAIEAAGLTFGGTFGADDKPGSVVTDQDPAAGTTTQKGTIVYLEMGVAAGGA